MLYKNLPPPVWRRVFPRRAALDALAASRALAAGRPEEAAAIARAYRDAHRLRRHYQSGRPSSGEPPVLPPYQGSIVWDYFARGRRRFSELPEHRFRAPGC